MSTWTPAGRSVSGRFRLLIPALTAAKVTLTVGETQLWTHSAAGDSHVLSPWFEVPAGAAAAAAVRISVARTGAFGTGGVTDVLICRAREGVATTAPAP